MRATSGRMSRRIPRALAAAGALGFAALAYVYVTLPDVRVLAHTNPATTAFMDLRAREADEGGRTVRTVHRWVPYSRISGNLTRAVIVAEDSAFWQHEGLDYQEIRNSIETAFARGGEIRGASTITQQLAKNLYLSPSRNPLRKLRELIITRRLEAALPKARIFEIYLNVVEWGEGIWGVEAAARTYFGVSASALSREQSALLAGALINPIAYSPARPPPRLLRRQQIILSRMGGIRPPSAVPVVAPAQEPDPTAPLADEIGRAEQDADDTPDTAPASPGDPSLPEPDGPADPPLPDPVPPLEEPARPSPADDGGPPAQ